MGRQGISLRDPWIGSRSEKSCRTTVRLTASAKASAVKKPDTTKQMTLLLTCNDDGGGRRRWNDLDLREASLGQPRAIIRLTVGCPFLGDHEHLRGEHHREGMSGPIVVEDEIVDNEGAAGLQSPAELSKDRDVVGRGFLVRDVTVDGEVILRGPKVGGVEIAAGLVVAVMPRFGGFLVAGWLAGIIVSLLLVGGYADIALRDFGLLLGALTLSRLASAFGD